MKHVIFLGDGMADRPLDSLGNRTPLMAAVKPNMDRIAREGLAGMVRTVPEGLAPGSDTANMSVMGYDPRLYYTGRSPLEAISMAVDMSAGDVAFRCNLVTLSESGPSAAACAYDERIMVDYSSDEIGSDEAARLIETVNRHFADDQLRFYPGKSYRHCLIWKQGPTEMTLTPPHDILTRPIGAYLPSGPGAGRLLDMMKASPDFLADHPVNKARRQRRLNPANAIWIWGQGTKPELPDLSDHYGLQGTVISAVDLVRGLGLCAGLHVVDVPGATGNIHTNFRGKAQAAIDELARGQNYIYIHVEAPDECGHRAEIENKVRSIELIDRQIIEPVWDYLETQRLATGENYRLMVLPDHPTPLSLRTHTGDPVPFACYSSDRRDRKPAAAYDEHACSQTGCHIEEGYQLLSRFVLTGFQN
ncbi:MAG: cofactor-independent phosphoglycerate mutase [Clostridiaceae bacterium]|nr:cofactor-independent phosphoglycerate mutase [Clostridiaceae bacterium]